MHSGRAHRQATTCRCQSDLRHDAHPRSVTVYYPWHPLANQALVVCGAMSHLGVASYVVTLPDGTKVTLPRWMTEARAARGAVVQEFGLASRPALEALRVLVDEVREGWARSAASASMPPLSGDQS